MAMLGENKLRKGPWDDEEDERLVTFVNLFGSRRWDSIARMSGLKRSGKSCRLRWLNYLRPNIKHGHISAEEEEIILRLRARWGNRWSRIARRLPGRTDNEIKNYWRSHLRRKAQAQEQGEREVAKQHLQAFNGERCNLDKLPEDIMESGNGSADDKFGYLDLELMKSPYDSCLSDWVVAGFSSDGISDSIGTFGYEHADPDLWVFPGSLWRMD